MHFVHFRMEQVKLPRERTIMEKNWVARLLLKYLYKGENKRNGRNSFEFNPFIL